MPTNPASPRVLIVGCGDIGNRLAQKMFEQKWQVWGMRRDTSLLAPGIHAISGDFRDPESFKAVPDSMDYLLFTGAATMRSEEGYRQAYIKGVQAMITAAEAMSIPPKRLFFTSSTAVYHQHQGEVVNEHSSTKPGKFNGQCMLQAESLLLTSHFNATNVRFSGIYGPGRDRLIRRALSGQGCDLEPSPVTNRIHSEDCAGVLQHLLMLDQQKKAVEDLYIASDHAPCSLDEILNWLASKLDIPLEPLSKQSSKISNKRCSNQRLLDSGYQFIHKDYRSGYGAMLSAAAGNADLKIKT